jgi:hypothetical protein
MSIKEFALDLRSGVLGKLTRVETSMRVSENERFFPRSRKTKIITTGIHLSISRIMI